MAQRQRYYVANSPAPTYYDDEDDLIDLYKSPNEPIEPQKRECEFCFDETADGCCLPCAHYVCASCINGLFTRAKACKMNWPPSCCKVPAYIAHYAEFFTSEFVEEYGEKELEYILAFADRLYCANPACAVFLHRQKKSEDPQCAKCGTVTCHRRRTEVLAGADHTCAAGGSDKKTEAWLLMQVTMERCPECRNLIELKDACNHMTCVCRHEFCFICLGPWYDGCENGCELYGHPRVDYSGRCLPGFQRFDNGKDKHHGFHKDTGLDVERYDRAGFDKDGFNRFGQTWDEWVEWVEAQEGAQYLRALQQEPCQQLQASPSLELVFGLAELDLEDHEVSDGGFGVQPRSSGLIDYGPTPPPGYLQYSPPAYFRYPW